jgi:hypothetical protein
MNQASETAPVFPISIELCPAPDKIACAKKG